MVSAPTSVTQHLLSVPLPGPCPVLLIIMPGVGFKVFSVDVVRVAGLEVECDWSGFASPALLALLALVAPLILLLDAIASTDRHKIIEAHRHTSYMGDVQVNNSKVSRRGYTCSDSSKRTSTPGPSIVR